MASTVWPDALCVQTVIDLEKKSQISDKLSVALLELCTDLKKNKKKQDVSCSLLSIKGADRMIS